MDSKFAQSPAASDFFLLFLYDEVLTSATGNGDALITEINCVF